MGLILTIIATIGWLAALVLIWSLARTAARADRMAEIQRDRRKP